MLITKKIEMKIGSKNINHFVNLGYNVKYNDVIFIDVNELQKGSHYVVSVKCDICGEEKNILYKEHLNQRKKHNFDTCAKCKLEKFKITNLEKYGVEHPWQNEHIKNKVKNTMLERYGVENPSESKVIREKTKKTIQERYGVDYTTQSSEVKDNMKKTKIKKYGNSGYNNFEKIKKTNLEKYGSEFFVNREKSIITNLEKYGVENVSQSEEIKEKKRQTTLKNWGVEYPLQSKEIMNKLKNTNIKKLGVPHPTMSKIITDKILETNINNGKWLKVEDRNDYYKYYLLVCSLTLKNKKKLTEDWNGYDYYTNEYILENFNLNSNNKNYPTIDHKNSIRYGFDNNISAEEISKIENLCITTRSNNSSKSKKRENEFKIQ